MGVLEFETANIELSLTQIYWIHSDSYNVVGKWSRCSDVYVGLPNRIQWDRDFNQG